MDRITINFNYYYKPKPNLVYNYFNEEYEYDYNSKQWLSIGGCSCFIDNNYEQNTLIIKKNNESIEFPFTCNTNFLLYKLNDIMKQFDNVEDIDFNEIKKLII